MPVFDADLPSEFERVLRDFLHDAGESICRIEPTFGPAVSTLRDFVLGGGKRLRPTFAWWAWRGAGGTPDSDEAEGVLRAVASLELIQACALIHDDVIDSSDSRRGSPTVHVAFAARHTRERWLGSAEAFGQAAAVLIGDLALAWAEDMFAECGLPPATIAAARPAWRAMRTEVLAGQYLDVHTQATGDTSVEAALRVDRLKTAAYTVQRPLHLGAALAGADDELIDALLDFGGELGVAFQLRDDLLGVFGDPSVTGKPAGDDLREGKRTLLVALGLDYAERQGSTKERKMIAEAVGDPDLTDAEVDDVRQALVSVGAVAEVERRIEAMTENALTALRKASLAEPAAQRLVELADRATRRTS
ncbi:polyprenyl synthetase family protein [Saccharomonospora viridis]|uniref:Geranylgeranyl pyrophosphate synthase n=1 Tax=Saccharomonospora viridis TaxID=1852 RepID=A0A837DEJ0_9PSEU|nr:polyprenyl synthetase family protein [Saccharomonospora viridis]KHF45732.1 geranylgeranyl pyrophosphate synthase [Saccharomonospora viridis]SFP44039.1 geranylgeranyl diphosphate synthase, type I [Saccharomonospora viridis]